MELPYIGHRSCCLDGCQRTLCARSPAEKKHTQHQGWLTLKMVPLMYQYTVNVLYLRFLGIYLPHTSICLTIFADTKSLQLQMITLVICPSNLSEVQVLAQTPSLVSVTGRPPGGSSGRSVVRAQRPSSASQLGCPSVTRNGSMIWKDQVQANDDK